MENNIYQESNKIGDIEFSTNHIKPLQRDFENQITISPMIFLQELTKLYWWNRQVLFHFPPPFCADFGVTVVMTKKTINNTNEG